MWPSEKRRWIDIKKLRQIINILEKESLKWREKSNIKSCKMDPKYEKSKNWNKSGQGKEILTENKPEQTEQKKMYQELNSNSSIGNWLPEIHDRCHCRKPKQVLR